MSQKQQNSTSKPRFTGNKTNDTTTPESFNPPPPPRFLEPHPSSLDFKLMLIFCSAGILILSGAGSSVSRAPLSIFWFVLISIKLINFFVSRGVEIPPLQRLRGFCNQNYFQTFDFSGIIFWLTKSSYK